MESARLSSKVKVTPTYKHNKDKITNRMAKLLWENHELHPSYILSPKSLQSTEQHVNNLHRLGNPLVLGTILSGVVGVLLIIVIIILGMWVRSRMLKRNHDNVGDNYSSRSHLGVTSSSPIIDNSGRQIEHIEIDSSPILLMPSMSSISMSTLDMDEKMNMTNETEIDASIQFHEETTFYSANDVSIPIDEGDLEKEQVINNEIIDADSDEQERTLCDSPI